MATLVNYTCKSFIKLAPEVAEAMSCTTEQPLIVHLRSCQNANAWS